MNENGRTSSTGPASERSPEGLVLEPSARLQRAGAASTHSQLPPRRHSDPRQNFSRTLRRLHRTNTSTPPPRKLFIHTAVNSTRQHKRETSLVKLFTNPHNYNLYSALKLPAKTFHAHHQPSSAVILRLRSLGQICSKTVAEIYKAHWNTTPNHKHTTFDYPFK